MKFRIRRRRIESTKVPEAQIMSSEYPEPLEEQHPPPPASQVDEGVITHIDRLDIGPFIEGFPKFGPSGPPGDDQQRHSF